MSDRLEWRNKHAVLLRETEWAGIASRENYKIRADLRPLFEAHPVSEELILAFSEKRLFREGCEFLARMMHRRAAVWWAYCCFLSLFNERKAVESGAVVPTSPMDALMPDLKELGEKTGIDLAALGDAADLEGNIDDFCKAPHIDYRALLADYVPPPQDKSAITAASKAVEAKIGAIDSLLPPFVHADFAASRAAIVDGFRAAFGTTPAAAFDAANAAAQAGLVTYKVDRADSPQLKKILALQDRLETMRQETIAQIKEAFPEQYPATPEAKKLLDTEKEKASYSALQATWRWIVAPDERNTTLALEAGNEAAGAPEGMLAYSAAWSFGDFAPEDKQMIPVPPELPGTGINSALLLMALGEGGHRKFSERYELYFNLGVEVVYGHNLWPEAVMDELAPHQRAALGEIAAQDPGLSPEQLARADALVQSTRKRMGVRVDPDAQFARTAAAALATATEAIERTVARTDGSPSAAPPKYQKWTPRPS